MRGCRGTSAPALRSVSMIVTASISSDPFATGTCDSGARHHQVQRLQHASLRYSACSGRPESHSSCLSAVSLVIKWVHGLSDVSQCHLLMDHRLSEHIHIAAMNAPSMRCTHCKHTVMIIWFACACASASACASPYGILLAANWYKQALPLILLDSSPAST